jgi:RNA polymerase sigma-70 factor (ECF subfamily)
VPPTDLDVQTLLANASWLRRLSRGLAGTDSDAEDLVQDAWMTALRAPPDPTRPIRPWLAEVVRNLVRGGRRRDARRPIGGEVDEVVAGGRSADDLLASLQLQRRLATLVFELDEPYRNVVLMRFYEGLASPDIAARLGVAAGTVRWRLSEGVRRLRAGLDAEGEPARWRALALLGGSRRRPGPRPLLGWGVVLVLGVAIAPLVGPPAAHPAAVIEDAGPPPPRGQVRQPPGERRADLPGFVAAALPALVVAADPKRPYTRDELIDDCVFHRQRLIACPLVAVEDWLRGWKRRWTARYGPPTEEDIAWFRRRSLGQLAEFAAIAEDERRDHCAAAVDASVARGDPRMPRDLEARWHACVSDPDCERASACATAVYEQWPDRPDR